MIRTFRDGSCGAWTKGRTVMCMWQVQATTFMSNYIKLHHFFFFISTWVAHSFETTVHLCFHDFLPPDWLTDWLRSPAGVRWPKLHSDDHHRWQEPCRRPEGRTAVFAFGKGLQFSRSTRQELKREQARGFLWHLSGFARWIFLAGWGSSCKDRLWVQLYLQTQLFLWRSEKVLIFSDTVLI